MKINDLTKLVLTLLVVSVVISACSAPPTAQPTAQPTPTSSPQQIYASYMDEVLETLADFEQAGMDYDLFLEEETVWYDSDGVEHNEPYWGFLSELISWYDVGLDDYARELSLVPENADIAVRFFEELSHYQEVIGIAQEAFTKAPAIPETQEAHDNILDCLVFNAELNNTLFAIISGGELTPLRENTCLLYEDSKGKILAVLDSVVVEEE
jgi:hypothetical protein